MRPCATAAFGRLRDLYTAECMLTSSANPSAGRGVPLRARAERASEAVVRTAARAAGLPVAGGATAAGGVAPAALRGGGASASRVATAALPSRDASQAAAPASGAAKSLTNRATSLRLRRGDGLRLLARAPVSASTFMTARSSAALLRTFRARVARCASTAATRRGLRLGSAISQETARGSAGGCGVRRLQGRAATPFGRTFSVSASLATTWAVVPSGRTAATR